jgi:hypothetical protein
MKDTAKVVSRQALRLQGHQGDENVANVADEFFRHVRQNAHIPLHEFVKQDVRRKIVEFQDAIEIVFLKEGHIFRALARNERREAGIVLHGVDIAVARQDFVVVMGNVAE